MRCMIKKIIAALLCMSILVLTVSITPVSAATVKLNKTELTLCRYHSYQLKVTGSKQKVKWKSSDKLIASVNSKGVVQANQAGTAKITAAIGKKQLKCTVHVKEYTIQEEMAAYGMLVAKQIFGKDVVISETVCSSFMDNVEFSYFKCRAKKNNKDQTLYFYIFQRETESAMQLNLPTNRFSNLVVQIDRVPMERMMSDRSSKLNKTKIQQAASTITIAEKIKYSKGELFDSYHPYL